MVRARPGGGPKAAWERSGRRGPTTPPGACQESSGADLETGEPLQGGAGLVHDGLDGLLALGDRRLLQQDDVLEEAVQATLGDLGYRLLGLALLAGGPLGDVALVGDDLGRDVLTREVLRTHRGDLHRGTASSIRVAVVGDEHADSRREVGRTLVHVGHDRTVEVDVLTELDLLADRDGEAVDELA